MIALSTCGVIKFLKIYNWKDDNFTIVDYLRSPVDRFPVMVRVKRFAVREAPATATLAPIMIL